MRHTRLFSKRLHGLFFVIALGSVLALLAACGSPDPTATPRPTATPVPGATPGPQEPTATPAPDFDAAAYFGGRTIRLMTSSNPGGGTDIQMRYIASAISPFIPGRPRLIASNVPPHVVGKNFIYQAQPDGLTIGLFSTSMLREENFPQAVYDSSLLTYIADIGESANVYLVRDTVPYNDIRDAMGQTSPVLRSMTDAPEPGGIESLALAQMMIADFLDIPFEFVRTAERGTGPALLALERGDINSYQFGGGAWGLLPAQRPGWLTEGFLRPLYDMGAGRGFFPNAEISELNVPHIYDLFTEEQRAIFIGVTEAPRNMDRPLVMPPDVPPHITAALRESFHTAYHDQAYCEGWTRVTGSQCAWMDGEQVREVAEEGQAAMRLYADQYDEYAGRYFERYVR